MEEERTLLKHNIVLDDFIQVQMKIPETLSAMELKAIMSKANKLFNLADVPIVQSESQSVEPRTKRKYTKRKTTKQNTSHRKRSDIVFTPQMTELIVNNHKNGMSYDENTDDVRKQFPDSDFHRDQLAQKIRNLKSANIFETYSADAKSTDLRGRKSIFSEPQIRAIKHYKTETSMSNKEIADTINKAFNTNFTTRQVKDKIQLLRNKGEMQ